jgi:tetratricopeptide (TPR) repeat protein/tRNA A-37 threonylcarbamoyl transferase component Bud32
MSNSLHSALPDWPPELALRVEEACTRFESAWIAVGAGGNPPRIEEFLGPVPEPEHAILLGELLALEVRYRIAHGECPAPADYLERFAGHVSVVEAIFEELIRPLPTTFPELPMPCWPVRVTPVPRREPGEGRIANHTSTTSSAPDDPEPWPTVPGYEILSCLGHGGMGVVFKARHERLNRLVALKMLRDGALAGPDRLARFRSEVEVLAHLHDPHIVQIYEVGEHEGQPYFALEFVEGGNLARKLGGTPQPARSAAELVEILARTVSVAHQRGIIHRDLKPANVLLTPDGQPKIADFGLAKRIDAGAGQTHTGVILGTPSYMSPEQASGKGKDAGPAADVYALGAILYELLTGRPPFKAATELDTLWQVLHQEPVPPKRLQPNVPRDLETICLKCLRKEPHLRYESTAALAEDLHLFLAGKPIRARPVGVWERGVKWARRRPADAALIALGTATVLGLLAGILTFNVILRKEVANARDDMRQAARRENVLGLRADIQELRLKAEHALAASRWRDAKPLLDMALRTIEGEPELAQLRPEIQDLLADADREMQREVSEVQREAAVEQAHVNYRDFFHWRDAALFRATFLLGGNLPVDSGATQEAARKALSVVGLEPEGVSGPILDLPYTEEQKEAICAGCYELLLLLANAVGQPGPNEELASRRRKANRALAILKQAERLRSTVTHTYHILRARYLAQAGEAAAEQARWRAVNTKPIDALDFFLLGYERLQEGVVPEAIVALDNALHRQPGHFWVQYLLAVAHLRSGQPDVAVAYLNACLNAKPESPLVYLVRGFVNGERAHFQAAEDDFRNVQRALDHDPDRWIRYGLYVNRGAMRVRRHDFEGAVADLKYAIQLEPNQVHGYVNLSQAYEEQARTAITWAHQDQPRVNVLLSFLGAPVVCPLLPRASAGRLRLLRAAGRELDRAITQKKDLPLLYRLRAHFHRECGEGGKALRAINTAIELSRPASAEDHAERGRILFDLGQYQAALQAFEDALKAPKTFPDIYVWRADTLYQLAEGATSPAAQQKHHRDAVESLGRYLNSPEASPPTARTYRFRGLLWFKLAEYGPAILDFTKAMETEPDAELYADRGWAYLMFRLPEKALPDFDKAIERNPRDSRAYSGRGLARVKSDTDGRAVDKAVADAREALSRGPQTSRLFYNATCIYSQAASRAASERHASSEYAEHALKLLRKAVLLIQPPADRWPFWQNIVLRDNDLKPIRTSPGFTQLENELFHSRRASP